jgi:hypothetical protein
MELLHKFDPELGCTFNSYSGEWQIFVRSNRIQSPISKGWLLLFMVPQDMFNEGTYPLVFARLEGQSARVQGDGKSYFARVESEMARDREKAEKATSQETQDRMMDYWNHTQIGSHRSGSNFSNYLS